MTQLLKLTVTNTNKNFKGFKTHHKNRNSDRATQQTSTNKRHPTRQLQPRNGLGNNSLTIDYNLKREQGKEGMLGLFVEQEGKGRDWDCGLIDGDEKN